MITIEDFADIANKELVVRRYPLQRNRYTCSFDGGEITDGRILSSSYGDGRTPIEAMNAYAAAISGKKIVFNAYRDTRAEFGIPKLAPLKEGTQ